MTLKENEYIFTSESVCDGHPDKVCDIISDTVLQMCLNENKKARVACEVMYTHEKLIIAGEISGVNLSFTNIAKEAIKAITKIGYDAPKVEVLINSQSQEIASGVDGGDVLGAGDQGMMFGYACNETDQLMPLPITLAKVITKGLTSYHQANPKVLGPDGKAQVSVLYRDNKPVGIDTIVVSAQHSKTLTLTNLRQFIERYITDLFRNNNISTDLLKDTKYLINPAGTFHIGGADSDVGLTGRKIIVDTYGGYCPHGGGAFSGKDPSKVDRSAAYMARFVAKNLVYNNLAQNCEVQLSYAIGYSEPVSVLVKNNGVHSAELENIVRENFDLTPQGIIDTLKLTKVSNYPETAKGHFFGDFPWEETFKL